jgi:hypothetical protein
VTGPVLGVAWYRFRATFGRRWSGYLALVLLVGLLGGVAMGAAAAARRTQSSFSTLLASTNPSDMGGTSAFDQTIGESASGYDPSVIDAIAHLPHVKAVASAVGLNVLPLGRTGAPLSPAAFPALSGEASGSVGGFGFKQDRLSVLDGRMADPTHLDEFVISAPMARAFGMHVGQVVPFGLYTNAQTGSPAFGSAAVAPYRHFDARLVGIVVQGNALVQDDVDAPTSASLLLFTPAFTKPLLACCALYTETAVRVDHARNAAGVSAAISGVLPAGFSPFSAFPAVGIEAQAERAIKPESLALGVFGAIAALAALLIAAQMIGRQLRSGAKDLETLRALGADPAMAMSDGLIGIIGAVIAGSLVAAVVAVSLSPLSPLGPVRPVYPTPGVAFDWSVLGLGVLVLAVGLSAIAILLAYRVAPHRAASRRQHAGERKSAVAGIAAASGLPAPAVTGIRFALDPGPTRNTVPVRSAILGTALAVIVVVAAVTFGASLDTLVSRPALYGWNWDYELSASQGGAIPGARAAGLLGRDHDVAAWDGVYFNTLHIDGEAVAVIGERPGAKVAPPVLSGHGLDAPDQIVLGAITLAQLHKGVGDSVVVRTGFGAPTRLRIVGTATMPAIGGGGGQHPEMGTGALVAYQVIPAEIRAGYGGPGSAPGPSAILVRLRAGASPRSLQQIAGATSTPTNYGVAVQSVLRPAEIVNYRSMGTAPAILGGALALGAVVALGLTLVASVRRRRHDLALLKTLGFTRRQLAATVAWQSTIAVGIGTIVGVPLGIVLGRYLWAAFAEGLHVVSDPTIPAVSILVVALGALALANVVAAIPARIAARTPTAVLLRAE